MGDPAATAIRPGYREAEAAPGPRLRADIGLRRAVQVGVVVAGLGMTLIVVDGSWWWAIARVVVVAVVVSRAAHLAERASRAVVAAVAVPLGLVAMAAGGAIAVSYVPVTAWSARTAGGVLTLVGGVVLVVVGGILAVRSVPGWWKVLTIPIVFALGYGVGFPVAMAVYATNVGRPQLGADTPADRGLGYGDVSFTTSDGVTLSGWYIPSANGAAVVLLHGASSTRSAVLDHAVVLARHGYGVLLYDARGVGRSGGRAMNFGWYGDRDVAAAVDYLASRPDVDPWRVGAVGESMGGEQAIGAMATDTRLHAVVAEGATNRVAGDWSWLAHHYGLRGRAQQAVFWLTYQLTDVFTEARPPITLRDAVAAANPRPVLLIAAGAVADEAEAAGHIQAGSSTNVQVWVAPGARHVGGLRTQPAEWEERVTGFLDAALMRSP